jgi:hypothetical protein
MLVIDVEIGKLLSDVLGVLQTVKLNEASSKLKDQQYLQTNAELINNLDTWLEKFNKRLNYIEQDIDRAAVRIIASAHIETQGQVDKVRKYFLSLERIKNNTLDAEVKQDLEDVLALGIERLGALMTAYNSIARSQKKKQLS